MRFPEIIDKTFKELPKIFGITDMLLEGFDNEITNHDSRTPMHSTANLQKGKSYIEQR